MISADIFHSLLRYALRVISECLLVVSNVKISCKSWCRHYHVELKSWRWCWDADKEKAGFFEAFWGDVGAKKGNERATCGGTRGQYRGQHVGIRQASRPQWLWVLLPTVVVTTLLFCCNRSPAGCEGKIHHASLQRSHNTLGRLREWPMGLTSHEYSHLTASPSSTLSYPANLPQGLW